MTLALSQLTDTSTLTVGPDGGVAFDLTGKPIRGGLVVAEQVLRSWVTDRGSLPWNVDQGENVMRLENATANGATLGQWRARLAAQAKRASTFVRACLVTVGFDPARRVFLLTGQLTLNDSSKADLEVDISQASGAILRVARRASAS